MFQKCDEKKETKTNILEANGCVLEALDKLDDALMQHKHYACIYSMCVLERKRDDALHPQSHE